MATLKIALLQMVAVGYDRTANLKKGEDYCRSAKKMGADLALFPEMWSIGYTNGFENSDTSDPDFWSAQAVGPDDAFVTHFRHLSRELDMAIAITYLEKWSGPPRNAVSIIDRNGNMILTYAKVHTCDFFPMEASCTPGDAFRVSTLETKHGPVEVGAMICYDREHPESARILMLKGAEIIITPNACTLEEVRMGQFRGRAFENAVGVAMTNYADGQKYCNGHSVAFDSEGGLIVEAGGYEGVYLAGFDLEKLRERRRTTFFGNAFRRPHKYELLSSVEVMPPFAERLDGFKRPWNRESR